MKYLIWLISLFCFLICCGPKQNEIERIFEDGVEVVINHLEPYKVKGQLFTLHLEEEFGIDTERDEIVSLGLTNIRCFDVDSDGNIYFLKLGRGKGNNIFVFDKAGKYITSFGLTGQGPGEFSYPRHLDIDNKGKIFITDPGKSKLIILESDGKFIREINAPGIKVTCLENGKFLALGQLPGTYSEEYIQFPLKLYNFQFEEVKELDRFKILNSNLTKKRRGTAPIWVWSASKKGIYTGNEDRDYEIWVYDLEGKLSRKIRKEYKKVSISEEYKTTVMKGSPGNLRKITFFPEHFPPYQSFFVDEEGRLFVVTYEAGENHGEYMFDIFNPDGVFIGRKSCNLYIQEGLAWGMIKKNLYYCLREKENGFKELMVYKMTWE